MDDEKIADLLCSEAATIQNPKDPNDTYTFPHIRETADVLIRFLRFPCAEPCVEGLGDKVLASLAAFSGPTLDRARLTAALEDLATAFESFLKKIAILRYEGDALRLHGDGVNYAGLIKTPLGGLLLGNVAKLNPRDASVPALPAPIVTFTYQESNLRETVYNRARLLRNEIHEASQRTLHDLTRLLTLASAAYLFALQENLPLIRSRVDPTFAYLSRIQAAFRKWEYRYVELEGEERNDAPLAAWPALHAFEWQDQVDDDTQRATPWEDAAAGNLAAVTAQPPQRISVADLSQANPRFWLIGEPGAGKTTTLEALAWRRAQELLDEGYLVKPLPVLVRASQFATEYPFVKLISDALGADAEQVRNWLAAGRLWLLIDGVNEVAVADQDRAHREMQAILSSHPESRLTLTSRKYGFARHLHLPVFELLPLNDEMILEYLERNMPSEDEGRRFFRQLTASQDQLLQLARNPLMLRMLARVVRNGDVPANRGHLLRLFTKWIFSREHKPGATSVVLKERLLSSVAFMMRTAGKTYATQQSVLKCLEDALTEWHAQVDVPKVFDELLHNHLLEMDAAGRVWFFHELVLEYFAALELERLYVRGQLAIQQCCSDTRWFEPLIMLAGLLDDADDLVAQVSQTNPVLAARCVASGARLGAGVAATRIIVRARRMLAQKPRTKRQGATALLELGTDAALRTLVKTLRRDISFPLTEAISDCERPDLAALGLLRFGLRRRARIYQCLRALAGKLAGRMVVDTPEVGQAELALLRPPVNHRRLALIDAIGISGAARGQVVERVKDILSTADITSALWRTAVSCAVHHGFQQDVTVSIAQRIGSTDLIEGSAHYSVFYACAAFRDLPQFEDAARAGIVRCWALNLHGLVIKYATFFAFHDPVEPTDAQRKLTELAAAGRLQLLVGYRCVFSAIDFLPLLDRAVDRAVSDGNLAQLLHYRDELAPTLQSKRQAIRQALLSAISRGGMRARLVRSYIRGFGLEELFTDYGFIRRYLARRRFGFITNLLTDEDVFFHATAVANLTQIGQPMTRDIVRYSVGAPAQPPRFRTATRVEILRFT